MATPIFCLDDDKMGYWNLSDLPITQPLQDKIRDWYMAYELTFDATYPPDSKFPTPEADKKHSEIGAELAKLLQGELGSDYTVTYKP
jgi:hypothetical protein